MARSKFKRPGGRTLPPTGEYCSMSRFMDTSITNQQRYDWAKATLDNASIKDRWVIRDLDSIMLLMQLGRTGQTYPMLATHRTEVDIGPWEDVFHREGLWFYTEKNSSGSDPTNEFVGHNFFGPSDGVNVLNPLVKIPQSSSTGTGQSTKFTPARHMMVHPRGIHMYSTNNRKIHIPYEFDFTQTDKNNWWLIMGIFWLENTEYDMRKVHAFLNQQNTMLRPAALRQSLLTRATPEDHIEATQGRADPADDNQGEKFAPPAAKKQRMDKQDDDYINIIITGSPEATGQPEYKDDYQAQYRDLQARARGKKTDDPSKIKSSTKAGTRAPKRSADSGQGTLDKYITPAKKAKQPTTSGAKNIHGQPENRTPPDASGSITRGDIVRRGQGVHSFRKRFFLEEIAKP